MSGSTTAIARTTGRHWTEWVETLTERGAAQLTHAQIARIALDSMPDDVTNPEWWAQGVAIAYEQEVGLRVPGQSSAGDFRVSASKTVPLDRDLAIKTWESLQGDEPQWRGSRATNIRQSRTDKRTFWRADLTGAGRVEVAATPKGDSRCTLVVSHLGLNSPDEIESWRTHWKEQLERVLSLARA